MIRKCDFYEKDCLIKGSILLSLSLSLSVNTAFSSNLLIINLSLLEIETCNFVIFEIKIKIGGKMKKKIIVIFFIFIMIIGIVSTLKAIDSCRSVFSKCTEGGCGTMIWAQYCAMKCKGGMTIDCSIPVL